MRIRTRANSDRRRGVSLLMVSFLLVVISVVVLALFTQVSSTGKAVKSSRQIVSAQLITEAGLSEAMLQLSRGEAANLGTEQQPVGYGSAGYWVEDTDLGGGLHQLVATGVENGVGSQLELVVREISTSAFVWAAFGDEGMTMDSNARVDSYDSSVSSYAMQATNGNGNSTYAHDAGNIGSNAGVVVDSNTKIWGDATPGPGDTVLALGSSMISGSTTPNTDLVPMPGVNVPAIPSMGDVTVDGGDTTFISSGNHHIGEFLMESSATVQVTGPATIVFDSFTIGSNAEFLVDATNGPVEIYVLGDFVMNSNTLISSDTYTPADITINLLSDNILDPGLDVDLDEVDFDSNAQLYGTVYAPNAAIEINSNFELFGALVGRTVHLDSNARVHFDEALLQANQGDEINFETVAWRQRSYQP